jgi:sigma-B regulation protein RsbU (phosphoserine phosphatase)
LHQIKVLSDFVKEMTGRLNLEPKLAGNIRLAVEEAVVNVMDYAYPVGLEGDITISAKSNGKWLKFIISDEGVPFDPTEALQVDTTLSAEERPVGGLGIHLVRQLMDSINYERIDGTNTLTLRKDIVNENQITN